jgi:NADPH:quinone reductase-like Zn-dependent oxidoreductase
LQLGQRVVVHPGIACGRCEFCLRGEDVLCTSMSLLGEHRDGTFAEYVCLPARNVFALPQGWDDLQAAALGVNHLTAWRMLFTQARLQAHETVLVFGVGGGVSLAALQLAKAAGARVIVTSRDAAKLERAVRMGADGAVHSATQDIARTVLGLTGGRGVDVVIENVGAAVWGAALKSLVRGGRLVTCGATSGDQPAGSRGSSSARSRSRSSRPCRDRVARRSIEGADRQRRARRNVHAEPKDVRPVVVADRVEQEPRCAHAAEIDVGGVDDSWWLTGPARSSPLGSTIWSACRQGLTPIT